MSSKLGDTQTAQAASLGLGTELVFTYYFIFLLWKIFKHTHKLWENQMIGPLITISFNLNSYYCCLCYLRALYLFKHFKNFF